MKVHIEPDHASDLREAVDKLGSWSLVPGPWGLEAPEYCVVAHDHYLACCGDGSIWAFMTEVTSLAETPKYRRALSGVGSWVVEFLLFDPPERDEDTISKLFFRLHVARSEEPDFGPARADEIIAETPFPVYRTVRDHLPEAPEAWLDLRCEVYHGFELSENSFVSKSTWDAYERDTLELALQAVCARRYPGILVGYSLATVDALPLLEWNVDWPLSRRGRDVPTKREALQGALPCEQRADPRLLAVYQRLPLVGSALAPSRYATRPTVRLLVGGRTQDDAVANWHQCAKALRRMKKGLVIPEGAPLDW